MKFVRWECGCIAIEGGADAIVIESHDAKWNPVFCFVSGGASASDNKTELGVEEIAVITHRIVSLLQDGKKLEQVRGILGQ